VPSSAPLRPVAVMPKARAQGKPARARLAPMGAGP